MSEEFWEPLYLTGNARNIAYRNGVNNTSGEKIR